MGESVYRRDAKAAERDSRIRLAVADERTRIARELHALVANSVSAMVVQTEAATRLLDEISSEHEGPLVQIETQSFEETRV